MKLNDDFSIQRRLYDCVTDPIHYHDGRVTFVYDSRENVHPDSFKLRICAIDINRQSLSQAILHATKPVPNSIFWSMPDFQVYSFILNSRRFFVNVDTRYPFDSKLEIYCHEEKKISS